MTFTFADCFAGIGGFHLAVQSLGGHCVFASEIDKHAQATYKANFPTTPLFGDIKESWQHIPENVDLLTGGFPCQPFSVAGKRKGFEDTRGTLFFEIATIIKEKSPKVVLLENVKGLKSHDNGKTLAIILDTLKSLGYMVYYDVLNAKDFGVPQNRERIFIVAFRDQRLFTFPTPPKTLTRLGDILLDEVPNKYYLTDKALQGMQAHKERHQQKGNGFGSKVVDENLEYSPTITSHYSKGGSEVLIFSDLRGGNNTIHSWNMIETTEREKFICEILLKLRRRKEYTRSDKDGDALPFHILGNIIPNLQWLELETLIHKGILKRIEPWSVDFANAKQSTGIKEIYRLFSIESPSFSTLTATKTYDAVNNKGIRRLLPIECARLQGFPDNFVFPVSDTQAYKQIGNAVCVPVVQAIIKQIFKDQE